MGLGYCDTVANLREGVDTGLFAYGSGFFPVHPSAIQIR
jgi:hypothetical protein